MLKISIGEIAYVVIGGFTLTKLVSMQVLLRAINTFISYFVLPVGIPNSTAG